MIILVIHEHSGFVSLLSPRIHLALKKKLISPNAPLADTRRILLVLCFLFIVHFPDLANACYPFSSALLLPARYRLDFTSLYKT
jgi:hypothetical protein